MILGLPANLPAPHRHMLLPFSLNRSGPLLPRLRLPFVLPPPHCLCHLRLYLIYLFLPPGLRVTWSLYGSACTCRFLVSHLGLDSATTGFSPACRSGPTSIWFRFLWITCLPAGPWNRLGATCLLHLLLYTVIPAGSVLL